MDDKATVVALSTVFENGYRNYLNESAAFELRTLQQHISDYNHWLFVYTQQQRIPMPAAKLLAETKAGYRDTGSSP